MGVSIMIRTSARTLAVSAAILGLCVGFSTPAYAQATRTWVSGVGDDVNPCSRTAPCKTFAGAISKTAAGGEINCLDPGGFGAVTITKAMTIDCHYTEGGVLAGGNGIVVNAGATDVVYLRGLDIFGVNPPTHGVRIIAGGAVHIEDCVIRRFNAANSFGVSFQPAGATKLFISNSTIAENGNGATGGGILVQPTGTGTATVALRYVQVHDNANNGVRFDSTTSGAAGVTATIDNSQIAGNGNGISLASGTVSTLGVFNSTIINNSGTGIAATGISSTILVGNTTITGNTTGVSGAVIQSFGDNRLEGNPNFAAPNNGSFTPPILPKK
jgi:hypothetical protein